MTILIVDDEAPVRKLLRAILEGEEHKAVEAVGVTEARRAIAAGEIDVVFTDQEMPDGSGLDVLSACRELDPAIPVIFLTGVATVELAVDAMRAGAFDFLPKPFLREQVLAVLRRAGERTTLFRENERLRGQVSRLVGSGELLGKSPGMVRLRELVARVAPTDATALILGETGSGKELVARALHQASRRSGRIFLPINCAGFAETLLESELFGHERGAFTGADRPRSGVFEAADGGTLFLDEAGEMSLPLQAKLLRVLVSGEMVRVGSTVPKRVDVRIIAATHRDLEERVRDGSFRQDLFYRLAVVPLRVPPLRDRPEDIPALVDQLLSIVARELKHSPPPVSPAAFEKLVAYDFPGNVRELRNLLERAVILSRGGAIEPEDLPLPSSDRRPDREDVFVEWIASLPESLELRGLLATVEKGVIQKAMAASRNVAAEAARRLGVSRSDLSYKLRRLGLTAKTGGL
jgi:DNA-binding NtrC family response regulator